MCQWSRRRITLFMRFRGLSVLDGASVAVAMCCPRACQENYRVHSVLLVDDDLAVRRPIARFLAFEGFTVIEADHGQAALTYLRSGGEASVIVLDLRMPVMDGWTFRDEQRRDPLLAKIPVVVVSGADTDRFCELEAAVTMQKPVRLVALVRCLRQLCASPEAPPTAR